MKIQLETTGSTQAFAELMHAAEADPSVKSILVLACDANGFEPEQLDPILKAANKPIFGGVFPGILHQNKKLETGTIVAGLTQTAEIHLIEGLSDPEIDYEEVLDQQIPDSSQTQTLFIFVDGLSQRISALVDSLFTVFGLEMNYIGGGAGSLSFVQKPVLFTNQGLVKDAALIALTGIASGIGVNHGWREIYGPLKVTDSDRNLVKSLDWKPAFQVYRDVVEQHSGQQFTEDNFFDLAKAYPFGISKLGAEKIVRDPLALGPSDSMICVGEVPQDVFLHILNGDTQSLVQAAQHALHLSKQNYQGAQHPSATLFIDCISRALFLEDKFALELESVFDASVPLIGALTLGEIANNGKTYLEFYNKTAVVGILE